MPYLLSVLYVLCLHGDSGHFVAIPHTFNSFTDFSLYI